MKPAKVAKGPLTAVEMWELGQAIAGTSARKISGRLDLEMGAGDCGFPSLLGVDAEKRPVAFLFGEAVRPDVLCSRR